MNQFIVGARVKVAVTVIDKATGVAVDPGTFAFRLRPPEDTGITAGEYAWNGVSWANSEASIGNPVRDGTGLFSLVITIPYDNAVKGDWHVGWKSVASVAGLGEGANFVTFTVLESPALG